ncbi:hypothetical protein NHP21005_10440 [Helicobacter sp. NHP21005]|nr:hypothetical protein NHP21005_10440 [Helicobacter sp. NHP21005]
MGMSVTMKSRAVGTIEMICAEVGDLVEPKNLSPFTQDAYKCSTQTADNKTRSYNN